MGGWQTPKGSAKNTDPGELLTTLSAVIWLGLYPLLTGFTYTRLTEDKALIALVLFLLTAVMMGTALWLRRWALPPPTLPVWLILGYGGWLILSALFGSLAGTLNPRGQPAVLMGMLRYEGLLTQWGYLCLFLMMTWRRVSLRPILTACGLSMMGFVLVVMLQYAGMNPLFLFPAGKSTMTHYEFQGTIGNIDMISGYLSLTIPLTLGGYAMALGGRTALAGGICGIFLMACMGVQGGLMTMGFCGGLLVFAMMWLPALRRRGLLVMGGGILAFAIRHMIGFPWLDGTETVLFPWRLTPAIAIALMAGAGLVFLSLQKKVPLPAKPLTFLQSCAAMGLLLALALGVVLLLPLTPSAQGLYEIQETLKGRGQDAFGSYRLGVWRHALTLTGQHPLWGGGSDTFMTALSQRLTQVGQVLPELFDNAHNEYLTMAANNGYPALFLYLAGMAALMITGRKSMEKRCLIAALLGYMAQAFFSFSIVIVAPMFWITAGLLAAVSRETPSVPPTE